MNLPLFAIQLRNEAVKLFTRKRTYLGFVVFLVIQLVMVWLLRQPLPMKGITSLLANNGFAVEDYSGGLTMAAFTMVFTVALVCGLYLALVSGDLIAKEIEDGTMRLILTRPVSRTEVFVMKAMVGAAHTALLMLFVGVSGLLVGWAGNGGLGRLLVYAPLEGVFGVFSPGEGLFRFALATLCMALTYQAVSALALMFSCLRLRPATATVLTLSVLYVDFVLNTVPYLASFKPWFLAHHLSCWVKFFHPEIPWVDILSSLLVLLGLTMSFLLAGLGFFTTRDIKG